MSGSAFDPHPQWATGGGDSLEDMLQSAKKRIGDED